MTISIISADMFPARWTVKIRIPRLVTLSLCLMPDGFQRSDVDETARKDGGTSKGQTHTTKELGCCVPGPVQGLPRHLHRGDGEKIWGEDKEHKRDVKTLEKFTTSKKKDS